VVFLPLGFNVLRGFFCGALVFFSFFFLEAFVGVIVGARVGDSVGLRVGLGVGGRTGASVGSVTGSVTGGDTGDSVEVGDGGAHPQVTSIRRGINVQFSSGKTPFSPNNSTTAQVVGSFGGGGMTTASGMVTILPSPHTEQGGNCDIVGLIKIADTTKK
jgi:hypothetical protein